MDNWLPNGFWSEDGFLETVWRSNALPWNRGTTSGDRITLLSMKKISNCWMAPSQFATIINGYLRRRHEVRFIFCVKLLISVEERERVFGGDPWFFCVIIDQWVSSKGCCVRGWLNSWINIKSKSTWSQLSLLTFTMCSSGGWWKKKSMITSNYLSTHLCLGWACQRILMTL